MKHQLELRQIKYFLTVAEELHFRNAAEKLFISQPGLSRQIKRLEDLLSVKLLERDNRNVRLTQSGTYLRDALRDNLNELERIIDRTRQIEDGTIGELKFGYVGSAIQDVIPKILITIRKKYPKIIFDLKEMDNNKQIESILRDEIDFGFVRLDKVPQGINISPIYEDTFSLVLPKHHAITKANFKSLRQLEKEAFILFDPSYSESYFNKVMRLFEEAKFTPTVSHNTVHANTIYRLVENNFGVSIVPTSLQKGYNMNIKFIELNKTKLRTTLQVIWSKAYRNPVIENVLDIMKY